METTASASSSRICEEVHTIETEVVHLTTSIGKTKKGRKRLTVNTNQLTIPSVPYCPLCNSNQNNNETTSRHSTLCKKSLNYNPILLEYTLYGITKANCKSCYRDYTKNVRTMSHSIACKRRKGNNNYDALVGLLSLSKSFLSNEPKGVILNQDDTKEVDSIDSNYDNGIKVITPTTEAKIPSEPQSSNTQPNKTKKSRRDPDKPLKYTTPLHIYHNDVFEEINQKYPLKNNRSEFWKYLKARYNSLSDEERLYYENLANDDRKRYEDEMSLYEKNRKNDSVEVSCMIDEQSDKEIDLDHNHDNIDESSNNEMNDAFLLYQMKF